MIFVLQACKLYKNRHTQPDAVEHATIASALTDTTKYTLDSANIEMYSLTRITVDHFNQYSHISGERVNQDSAFKKINGTLRLPLSSGKYYTATDTGVSDGSSDTYVVNEYVGQFNAINYYLVSHEGYETFSYTLIDKRTGEESYSSGNPVLSPHYSRLVDIEEYQDVDYLDSPYVRLEIRPIRNKKLASNENHSATIHIRHTDDKYSAFPKEVSLYWENENTLLMELTFKGNGETEYSDYLRLEIKF